MGEWLAYAETEIDAEKNLAHGHDEEPAAAAFLALFALSLEGVGCEGEPSEVELLQVREFLNREGRDLTSHQIGVMLRGMGFTTGNRGRRAWVMTGGVAQLSGSARQTRGRGRVVC